MDIGKVTKTAETVLGLTALAAQLAVWVQGIFGHGEGVNALKKDVVQTGISKVADIMITASEGPQKETWQGIEALAPIAGAVVESGLVLAKTIAPSIFAPPAASVASQTTNANG